MSTAARPAGPWQDRAVPAALDPDRGDSRSRAELISAAALEARLNQNSYDRFEDAVAAYIGVNRTAMRCMEVLDRLGQLTAGEIAVQTGITSGAVTAMLDRLERDDLVRGGCPTRPTGAGYSCGSRRRPGSSPPRSTDLLSPSWRGSSSTPTTSSG